MKDYLRRLDKLQTFSRNQEITGEIFGGDMKRIDTLAKNISRKCIEDVGSQNLLSILKETPVLFISDFLNTLSLEGLPYDSPNFGRLVQTVQRTLIHAAQQIRPNTTSRKKADDLFNSSLEGLLTDFISSDGTKWAVSFSERFYSWAHIRFVHGVITELLYKQPNSNFGGVNLLYNTMKPCLGNLMVQLAYSRPPRTQREKDKTNTEAAFGIPSNIGPDGYMRSECSRFQIPDGRAKPERKPETMRRRNY